MVYTNSTATELRSELSRRLPQARVDVYSSATKNEDQIALLDSGITILNKESVKGQEFDTVFILELGRFIPCIDDAMKRAMYMMCSRARDYLFLINIGGDLSLAAKAALPGPSILECE